MGEIGESSTNRHPEDFLGGRLFHH
jgi:hypothetical protein